MERDVVQQNRSKGKKHLDQNRTEWKGKSEVNAMQIGDDAV